MQELHYQSVDRHCFILLDFWFKPRMSGGACKCALDTYDVKLWDVRVGANYFIENRNESRTVPFPHPKGDCSICGDRSGLKMQCGHYICPDDLLDLAWNQIEHLKHEISCGTCPSIISIDDIITFGLPNDDEKQFLLTAVSLNYCESQDIQQCPGCLTYCQRLRTDSPQVKCTVCTKKKGKDFEFCWVCLKQWNNPDNYKVCGNFGCKGRDLAQLRNCAKKEFKDREGTVVFVPQMRACPKCFTILEHLSGCNEMTCKKCEEKFCFICLAKTEGGSLICSGRTYRIITCTPAPVQTKLRD